MQSQILPVAIVDSFTRDHSLGGLSFSHGESVEAFVGDVPTVPFNVDKHITTADPFKAYSLALIELRNSISAGSQYSALNLSSGVPIRIDVLGKVLDLKLNRHNLNENRGTILQRFSEAPQRLDKITNLLLHNPELKKELAISWEIPEYKVTGELEKSLILFATSASILEVLELLKEMTDKKVNVFIGAGNSGKHFVSLFTFAQGANVIKSGSKSFTEPYSMDNDLITGAAQGTFWLAARNINGNDVLVIDSPGCRDIPCDRKPTSLSSKLEIYPFSELKRVLQKEVLETPWIEPEIAQLLGSGNPKELPDYFTVTNSPFTLSFFDAVDGKLQESTKFVYLLYGTSIASPLFARNYLLNDPAKTVLQS